MFAGRKSDIPLPRIYSANDRGGEGSRGIDIREKNRNINDRESAKQWGLSLMKEVFTEKTKRTDAEQVIQDALKKLAVEGKNPQSESYKVIVREYSLFMKDIFDKNTGEYKQGAATAIIRLAQAIGSDNGVKVEGVKKMNEDAQNFMEKYPISQFKQTLYEDAIKHPIVTGTWVMYNEFRNIKNQVKKLGKSLPPEYDAVIQTIENIMQTSEFRNNTGKIDAFINKIGGKAAATREFQENMKKLIDMSAAQKKPLTDRDFDYHFSENRALTEREKNMSKLYLEEIRKELQKQGSKEDKLAFIDQVILRTKKNPDFTQKLIADINNFLSTERSNIERSANDTLKGKVGQAKRDFESSNKKEDVEKAARDLQEKTRIPHVADYDSSKKMYVIVSANDIMNQLLTGNIQSIDRGVFQSLLKGSDWQGFTKRILGDSGIAAVGLYLEKRGGESKLFDGIPEKKAFFIETYRQTVQSQETAMKNKDLQGEFATLFPSLAGNPRVTPEIQAVIKTGNMSQAYDLLAQKGISNGEMKSLIENIQKDIKNLKALNQKILEKESIKWADKIVQDILSELEISEKDSSILEKMKQKYLAKGTLSVEEKEFLLTHVKNGSPLTAYLQSLSTAETLGKIQGGTSAIQSVNKNKPPDAPAQPLTQKEKVLIENASTVGGALANKETNQLLTRKHLDSSDAEAITQVRTQQGEDNRAIAVAINSYMQNGGSHEGGRELIREVTNTPFSDKDIDQWIDSQVYLSQYAYEENFFDKSELMMAQMNLHDTRDLSEVYGTHSNILSTAWGGGGTVSLGESGIISSDISGISGFQDCRIEVGSSPLSRTLLTPDGQIIEKDIPLNRVEGVIGQLSRFYAMGLGEFAPYMIQVDTMINRYRTDKVSGRDGDYSMIEDKKFLKIFGSMLYGKDALPESSSIPDILKLFHSTDPSKRPDRICREKGILTADNRPDMIALDNALRETSQIL